jgi:bifunctional polynucleotide phosphatase/kinase
MKGRRNAWPGSKYQNVGTILFGDFNTQPSEKIAGFDMDSTLILTKSGKTFAQSADDWKWWDDSVVPKLKKAHEEGFKVVIFSNQAGVSVGKTTSAALEKKFINMQKSLKIPMQTLCATDSDGNRKPAVGMWDFFSKNCNGGVAIDKAQSFYCGDAAGRVKTKSTPKDFSDSDRKFAINCGIEFLTPEMYFLGKKEKLPDLGFTMKQFESREGDCPVVGEELKTMAADEKEMVLFVGAPGAGKSTLWKNHFSDYVRVNNDTLKTKEKCMKVAREALQSGKSCVIDNTNPGMKILISSLTINIDTDTRSRYTKIAKEFKVPIRCFFFDLEKPICMHNNKQRKINEHRTHLSKKVGDVIIHTFFKRVQKPTTDEGFSEVKTIKFVPGPFENDKDKEAYYAL